ncbi:MAG: NUDIX domain-containing protein [Gammaproteobacteria bacterium]|nr:NUDIX domain-containing protein [Gammaproteobacteria bacterium]MDH5734719.1 NUDIX domain-containing protein [Gammaproteobacteria bacterium]
MVFDNRPVIGVAALIIDNGRILLGYRKKSPGENSWQCPGGLLEAGESLFDCARRETKEETGLDIGNLCIAPYTNNIFKRENFHSVTLYVTASLLEGAPEVCEPELAGSWAWFAKDQMPESLFLPLQLLIQEHPIFWDNLF